MEDELLKELDSILQRAISKSWADAKRNAYGSDPRDAYLDLLKVQIDNTRVDISKNLYKIDQAMLGNSSGDELSALVGRPQKINVDLADYVRDVEGGTEVFDGNQWFLFSKESKIEFQMNASPEVGNAPLVTVNAFDPTTNFRVTYIDYDTNTKGQEFSYAGNADDFDMNTTIHTNLYYQDPFYNGAELLTGSSAVVVGGLETFTMAQHYVNYDDILRNPFSQAGRNYANGMGKWKMLDGQWASFDDIRNATGFKQQGLKVSANSARIRASKAVGGLKLAGKVCFGVSVVFSSFEVGHAMTSNDSNRHEVYQKAALDVTMGIIAFIPGVGWAISGTYFIADAFGAFGDWGKPSGISQEAYDMKLRQEFMVLYGNRLKSLTFEVDYEPPLEYNIPDFYREEVEVKIDNTYVAPRVHIKKIKH
ncbi:MAG: hypothetical protein WBM98_12530 [Maribacter sp.]|uniref:hypothetical protein n=1 Tax=Maribacter sp. TaxID=1897614 RepID=UPI003C7517DA